MSREAMKHTLGPWEVADLPHSIVVRTESPNKTPYGASRYAAIGGFDRSDPDQLNEALANARLIAAAPDLLKALNTILNICLLDNGHWSKTIEREAHEAIAKATGGEV